MGNLIHIKFNVELSHFSFQGKSRIAEIQEFSENIVTLQERKLAEIDSNMKEQKKLVSEMRTSLQSLQNSRINHKEVLVRHENQTKKLVELVNSISETQNEQEMERTQIRDSAAKRFSTFEPRGRRTQHEELYFLEQGRMPGSSRSNSRRRHTRAHTSGSSREWAMSDDKSRRKSTFH